jgi:hypothetical protein
MKRVPKPLLWIHVNFKLAGFDLSGIYACEFLPAQFYHFIEVQPASDIRQEELAYL